MDFPLLRRWLEVEPAKAMAYMRDGYGFLEAPRNTDEAMAILTSSDCHAAGLQSHRLTHEQCWSGEWVVGTCGDCCRALLWLFPANGDDLSTWPFYDQTIEMQEPANQG